MHKIKIILLSLIGIITVFIAIIVFILCSYDNQDYKQSLIKAVDNLSGYTLSIKGAFELNHLLSPVLSASKIELHSKTDNSYIYIDNFSIQITLAPLLSKTLLINDLLLENVRVEIQTNEDDERIESLAAFLPVPIIEHAVLKNVQLISDINDQTVTLNHLVLVAKDRQALVELHGTGIFKRHVFNIDGQLGPLADIFAQQKPYLVNLIANWKQIQLFINGTIADFAHGKGLDLIAKIIAPEIAGVYTATIPVKGRLHGKAHITGAFAEPILTEILVALVDKQLVDLQVTGSIGNLFTQEQTDLHLSGFIHDSELLNWIMPDSSPSFNNVDFIADISNDVKDYMLQNVNINLSNEQGFKIDLTGQTHIVQGDQPFKFLDIQAEISSKDTMTVKPYLGNILPEMGPVKGSTRITTQGKDFIFSNIDLLAGVDKKIQLLAKGRAGPLAMGAGSNENKIALELVLKAENSSELTSLLDIKHPEIGPVAITALLNGSANKLKLEDIIFEAGFPETLLIHAAGWIGWYKLDTDSPQQLTDIIIKAHSPSIQDASYLYGEFLPDLGSAEASMRIHGSGMVLTGSNLNMRIGTENSLLFKVQGKVSQIFMADTFYKGIELSGTLTGKSTSYLSELLESRELPDIGPFSGKIIIKGDSGSLKIPQISLTAGRKNALLLHATGEVAEIPLRQQVPPRGVNIDLAVTAPSSADLSVLMGNEIPDLGRLSIKGRLTDNKGIYAIEDLFLTAGNPKQPGISISGSVEDVLSRNGVQMTVLFDDKALAKLFNLHPDAELGPITGTALLSNTEGSFGIQNLKLETGESELIDLTINGAIEDIPNTNQISANVDISIKNPELFGKLFAIDLSALSPASASGLIRSNKIKATFKGNSIIGKTRFNNDLALSLINEKPEISGTINSANLFLEDFGITSAVSATSQTKDTKPIKAVLFSQIPVPLQVLHKVDLDLQLRIFKMTGVDYKLDKVNIDLLLQNGKLTASPINFDFSGGQVLMSTEINAMEKPKWSWSMQARNIQLAETFGQQNKPPLLDGDFNFVVDLKSSGTNAHEIAASLSGEVGFTLENGEISRSQLELVFLNPLGWLFSHGITENEFQISCGLMRSQIKQGIIRSKVFLIDGPKLRIRGKTEINLARETINSLYHLEKKNILDKTIMPALFDSNVAIIVSGNLADPTVEQAPLTSLEANADRYIFAPVAAVPREILGTVFDIFENDKKEQSPCNAYLEH